MKGPSLDARAETAQGGDAFKRVGGPVYFDLQRGFSVVLLIVQFDFIVSMSRRCGICIGAACLACGVLFHGRKPIAITPPNSVRPEAR